MGLIFTDENRSCSFDFSNALWATDQLNKIYHNAKLSRLSDVDFIAETAELLLFVEYKNAVMPDAAHPEHFNPVREDKLEKVAKKYWDSMMYALMAGKGREKRKIFVYVLEYPFGDKVARGAIRSALTRKLPFLLQKENPELMRIIDEVFVITIDEWNQLFEYFPATALYKNRK